VLSGGRREDKGRSKIVDKTIEEGDRVALTLREKGIEAEHVGITIEEVIGRYSVVLAPDGISGNLLFRALGLLGGWRPWGAPLLTHELVYVDSSRANRSFERQIALASALVSLIKKV